MIMIFLECNNDEILIKSLGFSRKQISHVYNKGEVVKRVEKSVNAIGIIDKDLDRDRPKAMNDYIEVENNRANGDIILFQKKDDKQKQLIQISPFLEHWLLNRAKKNKIKPKNFNLPDEPQKLHALTKLDRNKKFQKFLEKLIETDSEIQTLKKWIEDALG
jgi:hypothetical protein